MIRIKICGVTTPADAVAVSAMGADAIGINFIPQSPRFVSCDEVRPIVDAIKPFTATVGLIDMTSQYEWYHSTEFVSAIQPYHFHNPYWNHPQRLLLPVRIQSIDDFQSMRDHLEAMRVAESDLPWAVIADAYSPHALGGTGVTAPWHLLEGVDFGVPLILAGGLTPDNVAEAIRIVKPWGVDVASGVEKSPGVKDLHKVKDFIAVVREAGSAL